MRLDEFDDRFKGTCPRCASKRIKQCLTEEEIAHQFLSYVCAKCGMRYTELGE